MAGMTQATRLHCRGMGSLILEPWCHAISCCCRLFWLLSEASLPAKIGSVSSVLFVGLVLASEHQRAPLHLRRCPKASSTSLTCEENFGVLKLFQGSRVLGKAKREGMGGVLSPHPRGSNGQEGWMFSGPMVRPRDLLWLRPTLLSRCALFAL